MNRLMSQREGNDVSKTMIPATPIVPWWRGILARSLTAVLAIALLVGGASGYLISQSLESREKQQATQRISEILATVERTASIAAFAHDAQLAREVIDGLMRNGDVLSVTIEDDGKLLASSQPIRNKTEAGRKAGRDGGMSISPLSRPLVSPFNENETVGQIILYPNEVMIGSRIRQSLAETLALLMAGMVSVFLSVVGLIIFLVLRPIKEISERLHFISPETGEQIAVPEGHEKTEIGQLVSDVNELTNRLVLLLAHEREIIKQREIAQRKYQNLFDHAGSGIFVADNKGRLDATNPAFSELVWRASGPLPEEPNLFNVPWPEPGKMRALFAKALQEASSGSVLADDFLLLGHRGDERWLNISVIALGDGTVQGTVADVTVRKREEMQARRLAGIDALTGFANRQGLMEALSARFGNGIYKKPFALLMINQDGFSQINESMGLMVGDEVLKEVAARILHAIQLDDFPARIGGDEFVLIIEGAVAGDAFDQWMRVFFTELQQPFQRVMSDSSRVISIQESAGVAFYSPGNASPVDPHQLLRQVELALMSARRDGGHTYRYFEPHLQTAAEFRRRFEDELKDAVDDGSLYLGFQPIVELATGKVVGAESLMRWQHPTRGMISPDVFIPLAEQIGVIKDIGLLALRSACQTVSQWRTHGHDLYVSINVSALQIPNGLMPKTILDELAAYGLPPDAIVIEVTEGVLMSNVPVAQAWMQGLVQAGLKLYLDDFGTGYSSLSYLKRFPLSAVKIDKSFIEDLVDDANDKSLVNAIIMMAKGLSLEVVAEGVENVEHMDILRGMGCRLGQGFLFSPAVQAHLFMDTVKDIEHRLVAHLSVK